MESGDGREWREIEPKPSPSWPNDSIFPLVTGKPDMESEIIPNSWLIEVPSSMKRCMFTLLVISLFGCAANNESLSSGTNVFNLNGKNISVSDNMLLDLREKWKGNTNLIITSSLLKEADIQWSLDYISLIEVINSQGCNSLRIVQTRKFDSAKDIDNSGAKIEPGLFDYVWEVQVCDIQRNYRLVHQKGDQSFTLYPLNL